MEREFCELFDDVDDSPSSLEEDELYDDVCFLCSEQRRDFSVISLQRPGNLESPTLLMLGFSAKQ